MSTGRSWHAAPSLATRTRPHEPAPAQRLNAAPHVARCPRTIRGGVPFASRAGRSRHQRGGL
eukprot:11788-Prymnesium_polylepis.3